MCVKMARRAETRRRPSIINVMAYECVSTLLVVLHGNIRVDGQNALQS